MVEKAETAHQPVISIRISEELRSRLESLKEVIGHKTGQAVSTSEAAKQLLESARDDRLELANLLTEPTDSLLNIRGKADAHMPADAGRMGSRCPLLRQGCAIICEHRTSPAFL